MLLDIIFALVIVLALFKGYSRGLVIGLFSLIAIIVGLAAAIKLSTVVASWIGSAVKVSQEWLPLVAFIVVFIIVVLLIRLAAKAIESVIEVAMLGWINKIGGILLYIAIYTIVFSVLIFYAEQMKLLKPETIDHSLTYQYIQPWGPKVINALGSLIPFFKDMFEELKDFFGTVAGKIPSAR
ncbi:MAG TPA: CvpA family protein [Chitinophagaceae bacterium]|nr:CvpA family protein [Chitinophagaceae bacterium]